jgi:hypothetical protein
MVMLSIISKASSHPPKIHPLTDLGREQAAASAAALQCYGGQSILYPRFVEHHALPTISSSSRHVRFIYAQTTSKYYARCIHGFPNLDGKKAKEKYISCTSPVDYKGFNKDYITYGEQVDSRVNTRAWLDRPGFVLWIHGEPLKSRSNSCSCYTENMHRCIFESPLDVGEFQVANCASCTAYLFCKPSHPVIQSMVILAHVCGHCCSDIVVANSSCYNEQTLPKETSVLL